MHMEDFPVIHLRGQLGSLGNSIIQRLLREEVEIVLGRSDFEKANKVFSTELEFSKSCLSRSEDCKINQGHRVVLIGFQDYTSIYDDSELGIGIDGAEVILVTPNLGSVEVDTSEIDSHIIVHDMIPTDSVKPWENQFLNSILASLSSGEKIVDVLTPKYLVAELDVADALSRLLIGDNPTPKSLDISGRRGWSQVQIYQELEVLYNRTMAGQTGNFSTENLTTPSTPNIELMTKGEVIEDNRPKLEGLHRALIDSGFEGWRPTTPIRTALMYFLIGKLK